MPIGAGLVEHLGLRRIRPVGQIGICRVVGCDHSDLRAELDRKIADREPLIDAHRPDRCARKFDRMAAASASADLADGGENDVFRRHARRKRVI